jgi:hypothetical protein
MTSTETIWETLLLRLKAGVEDVRTFSRQGAEWGMEQLPALELWDNGTHAPVGQGAGLFLGWRLSGEIVVHARAPSAEDKAKSAFSDLNDLIDNVISTLRSASVDGNAEAWWDLDGLVANVTVGAIEKGGGALSGAVTAKVPISLDVLEG